MCVDLYYPRENVKYVVLIMAPYIYGCRHKGVQNEVRCIHFQFCSDRILFSMKNVYVDRHIIYVKSYLLIVIHVA